MASQSWGRRPRELRVLPSGAALIPVILLARQPPNLSSSLGVSGGALAGLFAPPTIFLCCPANQSLLLSAAPTAGLQGHSGARRTVPSGPSPEDITSYKWKSGGTGGGGSQAEHHRWLSGVLKAFQSPHLVELPAGNSSDSGWRPRGLLPVQQTAV